MRPAVVRSILAFACILPIGIAFVVAARADTPALLRGPNHVVVVVEENHGYKGIVGSPDAPFISYLATQGTLFTRYSAVAHPSEPNYLALFSGSTQGVQDDGIHMFGAPTLAGALHRVGLRFIGYAETGSPNKHKPWESFIESRNAGRNFSRFPTNFDELPAVSFVIPNDANNMHDGSVARGDRWLQDHLARYAAWAKSHNSLLIVTFDEDDGQQDNRVATVVVGGYVPASRNPMPSNHFSLLHTIETMYGLPALAESASAPAMNTWSNSDKPVHDFPKRASGRPGVE